jgi:hypothetical protein
MANRSYLYATDIVPSEVSAPEKGQCIGISEFSWAIPIVFKLLLGGNPRTCRSIIWKEASNIAIVGEYSRGLERLKEFLARIELPAAQPLVQEALDFLQENKNRRNYFLLECGEIFDLTEEPIDQQNAKLLDEIKNLDAEIEETLDGLRTPPATKAIPKDVMSYLLGEAKGLGAEVEELFGSLLPPGKRSRLTEVLSEAILSKLSRAETAAADPLTPIYRLGLGSWSNILYYEPDEQ